MKVELELLQALFAAESMKDAATMIQGERIYRSNIGGRRYYSRKDCEQLYLSLTSFLGATETNNDHLNDWKIQMALELGSKELQEKYVRATAEYGTALHEIMTEFCKKRGLQDYEVELFALDRFTSLGWGSLTKQAAVECFIKDFAAFVKFIHDYNVEMLAIELPVYGCLSNNADKNGNRAFVATCIDWVCIKDCEKYEKMALEKRKREKVGINLKSGRFVSDNHGLQMAGEMLLFNQCFGGLFGDLQAVYNLAPCDWRDKPTYKLTNQTKPENIARFMHMVEGGLLNGTFSRPHKPTIVFSGKFVYGEDPSNLISLPTLANFLTKKSNEVANNFDAANQD